MRILLLTVLLFNSCGLGFEYDAVCPQPFEHCYINTNKICIFYIGDLTFIVARPSAFAPNATFYLYNRTRVKLKFNSGNEGEAYFATNKLKISDALSYKGEYVVVDANDKCCRSYRWRVYFSKNSCI